MQFRFGDVKKDAFDLEALKRVVVYAIYALNVLKCDRAMGWLGC